MSETKKPMTKTDVINALAESSGLARKDVSIVIGSLTELIGKEIGKKGPQVFNVPGLMKITVITIERKPEGDNVKTRSSRAK